VDNLIEWKLCETQWSESVGLRLTQYQTYFFRSVEEDMGASRSICVDVDSVMQEDEESRSGCAVDWEDEFVMNRRFDPVSSLQGKN
jgi:hypothetical protein